MNSSLRSVGGTKVKMPKVFGRALSGWSRPRTIGSGCCRARPIRSRERSCSWATRGAQHATAIRRPPASPFMAFTMTRRLDGWSGAAARAPMTR
jgi:hypothetical protein